MNILITGVAGFIGINLADRLLRAGHTVFGLDNLSHSSTLHLERLRNTDRFYFTKIDVSDEKNLHITLSNIHKINPIEEVWHLAANSDISAGVSDAKVDLKDTFLSTFTLLQVMRTLNMKRIIFASSSAVYGNHHTLLDETTGPLFPISNYGAMKLASEGIITAACEVFLETAYLLRFPNVVGTPATHGVIYDLILKLKTSKDSLAVLGNGEQQKPYLHVSDLIDAMLFIVKQSHAKINCYNIGPADEGVQVKDIARAVTQHLAPNATHSYEPKTSGWIGDVPRVCYDTKKLAALGWQAKMTSKEAILLAVKQIANEHFHDCD